MKGLFRRLRDGLQKTRDGLAGTLDRLGGARRLSEDDADALEEALLRADVAFETTEKLLDALRRASGHDVESDDWARVVLTREIRAILERSTSGAGDEPTEDVPTRVVMIVGVNGTGKTTTIGKLAHRLRTDGRRVLVVAADTFRAAANEQLSLWASRAGVEIVQSRSGSDPAAVAFDGVSAGRAREMDIVLVDTAGRLHSKVGLMDEARKIHRVIGKALPGAPHDTWLVLDGTTGQNAIQQAREFQNAFPLTGLVLTKLDGTAKGGVVVSIADTLGLPVRYVGVGEGVDDLLPFDAGDFADALLAAEPAPR